MQLDNPKIDEVYERFAALAALGKDRGGLLLCGGLDAAGIATVMAANVAGVASLGIEVEAAVARQALRAGVCDFVVNTLDEALRILKNEVRQRRAASVVLTEDFDTAIAEIVSRGVQPDILAVKVPYLIERGAKMLRAPSGEDDELAAILWSVSREPMRWLPALDGLAEQVLGGDNAEENWRMRWLKASPWYLGRTYTGQRYVRMTAAEADRFAAAVESAVKAGVVQVAVQVVRNGQQRTIET